MSLNPVNFGDARGRTWRVSDRHPVPGQSLDLELRRGNEMRLIAQGICGAPGLGCGMAVRPGCSISAGICAGIALARTAGLDQTQGEVMRALSVIRVELVSPEDDHEETESNLRRWECDVVVASIIQDEMDMLHKYTVAASKLTGDVKDIYGRAWKHITRAQPPEAVWALLELRSGEYGKNGERLAENIFARSGIDPDLEYDERQMLFRKALNQDAELARRLQVGLSKEGT